ncbi:L-threonylcarbamoyladenylate synthase [Dialister sp.]|jgi:L-threonylcarbamoyladenylate synthase|uniref:L-threonylcarbamoyladenylate synthase n=1 Tax=Dialister sp. TaxID=1955814 RepID=UPI003A5BFB0C
MNTEMVKVDEDYYKNKVFALGEIIRAGGLVAFPTETVYGLGGNALDAEAAKRIYAAKGRPSDNPLIVHVSEPSEVEKYVKEVTPLEKKLMDAFWPGPLTIVFPKKDIIPLETSGGLSTIAIRCPRNEATRALIRAAGVPLAGPSANISTRPSPTTAEDVLHDMDGRIPAIVDGGPCEVGLESTVIGIEKGTIIIYRPGGITLEMLSAYAPTVVDKAILSGGVKAGEHPKAPGMKYRHYAPSAPLTVYTGNRDKVEKEILSFVEKKDKKYGFFVSRETADRLPEGLPLFIWGSREDKESFAHNLFSGLLYFNKHPVDQIIGEGTDSKGLGLAIMNRLTKASGYHIVVEKKD